jgi:hypothetical protein
MSPHSTTVACHTILIAATVSPSILSVRPLYPVFRSMLAPFHLCPQRQQRVKRHRFEIPATPIRFSLATSF